MKKVFSLILSVMLMFSSCTAVCENEKPTETELNNSPKKERLVAVWIYYNEIENLVKSSANETEFKNNVKNVVNKLLEFSVNTVILHVRAFDDAFYVSDIFPASKYCSDVDGKLKYDVLKCFIDECHSKNLDLWGWVNPYRINKVDDIDVIQEGYFQAEALNSENEQIIIHSQNGVYYNPADTDVKKHIIDGIREILERYDLDGIHFDDYFYPRTDNEFDSGYYDEYAKSGGKLSLSDFRRENVNSLIRSVYSLVKKYNKVFSISPISNIDRNFNGYYADVTLWAETQGYVDYIIPQIYFGFENPVQPFADTLKKWVDLTGDSKKLAIGLALYKSGITDSSNDEWKSRDVISKEIEFILKNYENIGFVYYSASFLYNPQDDGINTEILNIKNVLNL